MPVLKGIKAATRKGIKAKIKKGIASGKPQKQAIPTTAKQTDKVKKNKKII